MRGPQASEEDRGRMRTDQSLVYQLGALRSRGAGSSEQRVLIAEFASRLEAGLVPCCADKSAI